MKGKIGSSMHFVENENVIRNPIIFPGDRCPKCKNGIIVERVGKYGTFLGCNCFPECKCIVKTN